MNRTRRNTEPAPPVPIDSLFSVESAGMATASCDTTHALFAPLHYEPGYAYPLIVWLHGGGGDERQLLRIMPLMSMQNYVAIAPRGLHAGRPGGGRSGYGWQQSDDHIQQAQQRVLDSIEIACDKLHVAPQRVFLAGFDCGGTMALRVAMRHPQRFAGVVSLCGPLPTGGTLLSNLTGVRRLPVLMAVGRYSLEYPQNQVCADLRLLHSAGMSVTLRQYPSGHELSPQMLADVNRWIIEQITAPHESTAQADARGSYRSE
jgi:phospholipase/carboxylesterase